MRPRSALVCAALAASLVAKTARADHAAGIALDQLDPAPAGDAFVGVPSPYAQGEIVPRGLLMFDSAIEPLRIVKDAGASPLLQSQAFLHINASLAIQNRLLVSALLPVALLQSGDGSSVEGTKIPAPSGTELGDLRVGLRVRLLGEDGTPIQFGVGAYLYVPTAKKGSFTGEGSVRESPHLALGGRFRAGIPFVWTAAVGTMIRSSANPSTITYGAGIALSIFDRIQFGPEFYASTPVQSGTFALSSTVAIPANQSSNAELLLGARSRVLGGIVAGVAAGPGLTQAIGTPTFRLVGSIGWSPGLAHESDGPRDSDGDGIPDSEDACPYAFGPRSTDLSRNGCPLYDDDEDGIPNFEDACPQVYGVRTNDPKTNGCPPPAPLDTDGDGIPDSEDACPNEKGVRSADKSRNGCPSSMPDPDTDGDGIPDSEDACPRDRGVRTSDASTNGCPKGARAAANEVVLTVPIRFTAGNATIDATAEAVLTDVSTVLAAHTEFAKVEVQSHTTHGVAQLDQKTSQARADAIRAWLIAHGISGDRLVAKGYGGTKPLGDETAKNDRIQFAVIEKR